MEKHTARTSSWGSSFEITGELTRYYAATELWDEWAYHMAWRERLGSTGIGGNVAVPHQFQVRGRVTIVNRLMDWWLILLPHGIHWNSLDDKPVHAMFTHIFPGPWGESPHLFLGAMDVLTSGLRSLGGPNSNAVVELSRMDRVSAARLVNHHVIMALTR